MQNWQPTAQPTWLETHTPSRGSSTLSTVCPSAGRPAGARSRRRRGASFGITLQRGDEGTGPPPHSHDWDEAFYVLGGQITFLCDGKAHMCQPGTLVHVPRGTVHGFQYGKGGGQMLEITGQGALASEMFAAIDHEIPAGPPDIPRLLAVLARNGVTVES
jgi:quercetin dioxygenase-like cupin family protein